MTEPIEGSSSTDWMAVMAQALEESGGPLTDDELQWAESELGLQLHDAPAEESDGTDKA
jgi:hypothetical protein